MNLDKTFCASRTHEPDCERQITPEVQAALDRAFKKYVSMAYFCSKLEEEHND